MNKHEVLVIQPIHPAGFEVLAARSDIAVVRPASAQPQDLLPHLTSAEAVLLRGSQFPARLIEGATRLKLISRHGVGLDNVPLDVCAERGVTVAHVGDVNAIPVAEHAMALLLAILKQLIPYDRAVREGRYGIKEGLAAREADGKTLLILGLGRTGREVARLAGAFRMRCVGFDPALSTDAIRLTGCEPTADWRSMLPQLDAVTLHLPLRAETRGLIGPAEFQALRRDAVIINCARGGLVDEAALAGALQEGRLFGAGLDVTEAEPPPRDHPLLRSERVVLTPHSAALTAECSMRMAVRSAQNILDFFDQRLDRAYVAAVREADSGP